MNSPAPNVPYNLTVAKVKASERPADYEALEPVDPVKVTFMGKGKGPAKKRARDDDGDATATMTTTKTWTPTTTTSSPARYRTEKPVSYERWPFEAPSKVSRPPPCGSTSSSANRTRRN